MEIASSRSYAPSVCRIDAIVKDKQLETQRQKHRKSWCVRNWADDEGIFAPAKLMLILRQAALISSPQPAFRSIPMLAREIDLIADAKNDPLFEKKGGPGTDVTRLRSANV